MRGQSPKWFAVRPLPLLQNQLADEASVQARHRKDSSAPVDDATTWHTDFGLAKCVQSMHGAAWTTGATLREVRNLGRQYPSGNLR